MTVDLDDVSAALLAGLTGDSVLDAFRKAARGDGQPGLSETRVFTPRLSGGRFEVPNHECPYLAVCTSRGELLGHAATSRRSDLVWARQILGVWETCDPTFEGDASLKEYFELTLQAVADQTMLSSLEALGVRHVQTSEFFLDGLTAGDQAFFTIDVLVHFGGEATT